MDAEATERQVSPYDGSWAARSFPYVFAREKRRPTAVYGKDIAKCGICLLLFSLTGACAVVYVYEIVLLLRLWVTYMAYTSGFGVIR